ncbi:MAG: hypothetical protein U9R60_12860 [Bacteroidota bacterium]|nr:hypothetical protein [Bacteroidota bacterium]
MKNIIKVLFLLVLLIAMMEGQAQESKQQFFVFLNPNADAAILDEIHVQKILRDHLNNMDSLHQAGYLLASGPFREKGGILVLLADSLGEAHRMLASDPAIIAERFIPEVFPFIIEHGNLCEVGSKYTMGEYQFLRLSPFPYDMKELVKPGELEAEHLAYIDSKPDSISVLLQGSLGADFGKVIIYNTGDRQRAENVFQRDPYVRYMKYAYEIRTLWVARESLCE